MVYVEPAFPRGKNREVNEDKISRKRAIKDPRQYGASTTHEEKSRRPRPKERRRVLLESKRMDEEEETQSLTAQNLNYDLLQQGMLVFGCVRRIMKMQLEVALPGRLWGIVPISSISDVYSKLLKKMVDGRIDECPDLNDLYALGDLVYVKVVNKQKGAPVRLSLSPKDLHSEFIPSQLAPGLVLSATIAAEEDHGFLMETGIRNVRAFLPRENLSQNAVDMGRNLCCSVESVNLVGNGATVILRAFHPEAPRVLDVEEPNLNVIVPGCQVTFTVGSPVTFGLQGMLFDDTVTAFVNELMLTKITSKPHKYTMLKSIPATILYVTPSAKQVYVSLVPYPNNRIESDDSIATLSLVDGYVTNVNNEGVWLKFNNKNNRALILRSHIMKSNKTFGEYNERTVLGPYKIGTVHKVQVVRHAMLDRTYIVNTNLDESMNEDIHSSQDVEMGKLYQCLVTIVLPSGEFFVNLGCAKGSVMREYYDKKNPVKKGNKVLLRAVRMEKHQPYIKFTNHPDLVDKAASILANWKQLDSTKNDQRFHGLVVKVTTEYVLVEFSNDIVGILYKHINGIIQDEQKLSKLGIGVVEMFTVRDFSQENSRLLLSLPSTEKRFCSAIVTSATVTCVHPTGVDVKTADGNSGTIALENFSDFGEHNSLHARLLKEGEQLTVVKLSPNTYSVRGVDYFQKAPLLFRHVKPKAVLKANCFTQNGCLFANLLLNDYSENITIDHLDKMKRREVEDGSIILVQILKIFGGTSTQPRSFKVSTSLRNVCQNGIDDVYSYMAEYWKDVCSLICKYQENGASFANYSIGQRVNCTIEKVIDGSNKMVVNVTNGDSESTKGIAITDTSKTSSESCYEVGDQLPGRVVWVDVERQLVHVCLDKSLIDRIQIVKTKVSKQIDFQSNPKFVSCQVLFSNNFVRVCCILDESPNLLVLVPVKNHYNDMIPFDSYGQLKNIRLVRMLGPMIFGMRQSSYDLYSSFAEDGSPKVLSQNETMKIKDQKIHLRSHGALVRCRQLPETFEETILDESSSDKSDSENDDEEQDESDDSCEGNDSDVDSADDEDFVCYEHSSQEENDSNKDSDSDEQNNDNCVVERTSNKILKQCHEKKIEQDNNATGEKETNSKKRKHLENPSLPQNMRSKKLKTLAQGILKKKKVDYEMLITERKHGVAKKGKKDAVESVKKQTLLTDNGDTKLFGKTKNKKKKQKSFVIDQLDGAGNDFLLCQQLDGSDETWPITNDKNAKGKRKLDGQILPGTTNFWDTTPVYKRAASDSSDEDGSSEDEEKQTAPKKRLTAKERFEAMKLEEERLRNIEQELANPSVDPHTPDQFDRLVLAQPNNSMLWIRYMVFHMESAEVDKARVVGRKALKAINFREETELLNIWIALLNLEIRYETVDSFKEVLQEAIQYNDAFKVYSRVLDILIDCQKHTEVRELLELLQKRFRKQTDMWILVADAWYRIEQGNKVKPLLSQALKSLPTRDHISLIVKFAFLHNRNGNQDEAQLLFEQILTSYPKRTDIWSQYVDMLVKDKLVANARQILERAIMQRLPMKNMKTLYTKYVNFEEKHGDRDSVRRVKQMAADYVQGQLNNAGVTSNTN
ncbi:protein RRP5 homolog [Anopheles nili]|uniref:protein RRP5 homolog n=1 Tax=Anopheles nili TaxID=185578 RepID=UPI00237B59DE|nr:protein RRP5 homolog [Anopheles nili]